MNCCRIVDECLDNYDIASVQRMAVQENSLKEVAVTSSTKGRARSLLNFEGGGSCNPRRAGFEQGKPTESMAAVFEV